MHRQRASGGPDGSELILDCTGAGLPTCATHLSHLSPPSPLSGTPRRWAAPAGYALAAVPGGGFMLQSPQAGLPSYWLPQAPRQVQLDAQGRLLQVEPARLAGLTASGQELSAAFEPGAFLTETIVWQLPPGCVPGTPGTLERSAWYTMGSHTVVRGRGDVYRHLVAGTVYENRRAWPNDWRVFSENDAHALHLILVGLARAEPDPVLDALRRQLVLAVLDRQSEDGGFRHGEWTQLMESHFRLHCSAMHLMMDAWAEQRDPALERALRAAAAFMARQHERLSFGTWFLHDELEQSVEKMRQGPFRWVASRVFGKSESNMLVLNSHLDATIALHRYAQVTGDLQFEGLVRSAREATAAVLGLRSAQALYRLLFWLIEPTLLPADRASALPLWKRALKRLTWQWLIPRLPDIKARFPRLVMPGGYIDRELTLRTWAHDYHAINLMDLARYLRRFDDAPVRDVLVQGLEFTHRSGILQRWRELDYQKYALGFWAETLYHACTLFPDARYRAWLAEVMQDLEDLGMGLPPSLLGANAEAVPVAAQLPCPSPADARLRVANLGRADRPELLLLNPTREPLAPAWHTPPPEGLRWRRADGSEFVPGGTVGPREWMWTGLAH